MLHQLASEALGSPSIAKFYLGLVRAHLDTPTIMRGT